MRIRAAVFRETAEPRLEDLELAGPREGEVLVRTLATGVCHTDLKSADPASRVPRPVVLGHEGAGVIEAVGEGVTRVAPGDHVVMSYGSCGRCPSCRQGYRAYCHATNHFASARTDYLHRGAEPIHGGFFAQSSFATRAIGSEHSVVKVRNDAPLEYLGPLGCGMQTGAGVVLNDFRLAAGQTLAIFGVGSVGLSALMAARLSGAARIIAVDRHAHRLELARELGATDIIRAANGSVTSQIMKIAPAGVDFSFDTTGIVEVMQQAVDVLAPMGTCSLVTGPWDGAKLPVSPIHLLKGRSVRSTSMGGGDPATFIPRLVDFFMDGRFDYRPLVKFYPFEDIAQAFHDTESGATVKPILRMS